MPRLPGHQLTEAVSGGIVESGYSSILLATTGANPRRLVVLGPDGDQTDAWVYVWTLTPGGRPSLPHEYRIQMTGVKSPLSMNTNGPTVLLGYEPALGVFAGFDLERHRTFTPGSPSVQIDIRTVEEALQNGLSFDRKDNAELAIGIRPDLLMAYIHNSADLHRYGASARLQALLHRLSVEGNPATEQDLASLTGPRRRLVRTVSAAVRLGSFRMQVLRAYGYRCAVTKTQLRLVDAAHILPVGVPGSSDDIRNAIALSPTYHRAFDRGLIYLDQNLVMRVNERQAQELADLGLGLGLSSIKACLGKILVPLDRKQWPHRSFITKANKVRGVL